MGEFVLQLAGRGCGCAQHGRLVGHHCGECVLDFLDGLGQGGIGCNEAVDGGVLLDGHVGKVV